tara:strand:- start:1976 stop:2404 length:429 start_codon:yes stop_codon:yes gene_type:complete
MDDYGCLVSDLQMKNPITKKKNVEEIQQHIHENENENENENSGEIYHSRDEIEQNINKEYNIKHYDENEYSFIKNIITKRNIIIFSFVTLFYLFLNSDYVKETLYKLIPFVMKSSTESNLYGTILLSVVNSLVIVVLLHYYY